MALLLVWPHTHASLTDTTHRCIVYIYVSVIIFVVVSSQPPIGHTIVLLRQPSSYVCVSHFLFLFSAPFCPSISSSSSSSFIHFVMLYLMAYMLYVLYMYHPLLFSPVLYILDDNAETPLFFLCEPELQRSSCTGHLGPALVMTWRGQRR